MSERIEDRIRSTYEDLRPTEDIKEDVMSSLPEIPRLSRSTVIRPAFWIAGAAAALLLVLVGSLLTRDGTDPANGEESPNPAAASLDEVLGEDLRSEIATIPSGLDRIRVLANHRDRLAKLDATSGAELANLILEGFPWRETYVDGKHQKDLFAIRDLVVEQKLVELSWLFVRLLEHDAAYVRLHAVQRLRDLDARRHEDAVTKALGDADDRVRSNAALALVAWDARARGPAVLALLSDPDEDVRRAVARALAAWNDAETKRALVALLDDAHYDPRSAAAASLERMGAKDTLPALRRARAREQHLGVARILDSAIRSLEALRGVMRPVDVLRQDTGPRSPFEEEEYRLLTDLRTWQKLWDQVSRIDLRIGFERYHCVAVFGGKGGNSRGYDAVVEEDDERVRIRLKQRFYQTMNGFDEAEPWLFVWLRRSPKPIVIEENVQGTIGGDPEWKVRAVLTPK